MDRVNKIDKKYKALTELEIEVKEMKERVNIIAYKKQMATQGDSKLSEEQLDRIYYEL